MYRTLASSGKTLHGLVFGTSDLVILEPSCSVGDLETLVVVMCITSPCPSDQCVVMCITHWYIDTEIILSV